MTDPNRVILWCDDDGCDVHLTLQTPDVPDLTTEERAEMGRMLVAMARRRRWSIVGRHHRCPACSAPPVLVEPARTPRFADGTAPGTQTVRAAR